MNDYSQYSYWLEQCGSLTPRAPLDGARHVDVAIVGAGFTGLWTAYYMLKKRPGMSVAVLERDIAGFGASGRNGGWCNATMFGLTPGEMMRRWGKGPARDAILTMRRTLDEVASVIEHEGLEVDLRRGGVLRVARGAYQVPLIDHMYQVLDELRLVDGHRRLSARQAEEWVAIRDARGALYDPFVQWLQPAKLARGLAEAVERLGGTVYERTGVTAWSLGGPHRIQTSRGDLTSDALILATEAYTTELPGLRRSLAPIYSFVVLTEPLSEEQWKAIGWQGDFTLSSQRLSVDYLSKTPDGRVMFGGRGAPYHFGSKIRHAYDRDRQTHELLRAEFRAWFPEAAQLAFTHSWGGPLGVPRDWQPNIFFDPRARIGGAFGYSGQGVAMTNVAGRFLSDATLDQASSWRDLPFIGHRSKKWEVEPLRWLGVRYVQAAMSRLDDQGTRTGRAPTGRSLGERLARH